MELKPNMYVRTKDGEILKIKYIEDVYTSDDIYIAKVIYFGDSFHINSDVVAKASYNIIDLIEVGDYVNGYRVDFIENKKDIILLNKVNIKCFQKIFCEEYEKDLYSKTFREKDIKSIVTKEQFESMSYKVGD